MDSNLSLDGSNSGPETAVVSGVRRNARSYSGMDMVTDFSFSTFSPGLDFHTVSVAVADMVSVGIPEIA